MTRKPITKKRFLELARSARPGMRVRTDYDRVGAEGTDIITGVVQCVHGGKFTIRTDRECHAYGLSCKKHGSRCDPQWTVSAGRATLTFLELMRGNIRDLETL